MDYPGQVIEEFSIDQNALVLHRMIRELIHTENDLKNLRIIYATKIENNEEFTMFQCLRDLVKIKNNVSKFAV